MLSRDDKPLVPDMEAKEHAKLAKRENESAEQREKQRRDYDTGMDFLDEVPDAFNFPALGRVRR